MGNKTSLRKKIEEVVHQRINPLFELDNGHLEVVRAHTKSGHVQVRLGGSYRGSPARDVLIQFIVAPVLTSELEDVQTVEWVE